MRLADQFGGILSRIAAQSRAVGTYDDGIMAGGEPCDLFGIGNVGLDRCQVLGGIQFPSYASQR